MKLIADSGSTKTDWALIQSDQTVQRFTTVGFNPYYIDTPTLISGIREGLPANIDPTAVRELHFYGAGCSSGAKAGIIHAGLRKVFVQAKAHVNHDLLGAARALFHREAGIAVIIGTGSNTCLYNGEDIVQNFPALGYILGDEGSGARMGAELIRAYLRKDLPRDLHDRFFTEYELLQEDVLDAVYSMGAPNRFLASFTTFLGRNLTHPWVLDLVGRCFDQLFDTHICRYPNFQSAKIRCTGSIAWHFSPLLQATAVRHGAKVEQVIEFPIERLIQFHGSN